MLLLMLLTGISVIFIRNLFAVVVLAGIFSLLAAVLYVVLDAVDVAFTEAAVGAGISTLLLLGTLALTTDKELAKTKIKIIPLLLVIFTGTILILGTRDMPNFGDPKAPANLHVAPRYIEESMKETGLPNMVTSVLASYRGYDTFGEVVVIFTAAIGVLILLGLGYRKSGRSSRKINNKSSGDLK